MTRTRQPLEPLINLELHGERPRLLVDCGFREFRFHFDDCEELERLLCEACRNNGMPLRVAQGVLLYAMDRMGSYEDDSPGAVATEARSATRHGAATAGAARVVDWGRAACVFVGLAGCVAAVWLTARWLVLWWEG